jgi:ABC-type molybdate transport system ATPase subunit
MGVDDIAARVDELVEQLDLGELRRRPLRLLSSGQQTRVQLAKALVNEPELLVLDEPTASLDPDVGDRVRALLLRLARGSGRAMLITSHNMREIERMCDRVHMMAGGRIVATGSAAELADRYGVVLRDLYALRHSVVRVFEILYWPLVELLIWGYVSMYLQVNRVPAVVAGLLGGVLLWQVLFRSQSEVSIAFMEDVWSRNLLNVFASPLTQAEYLAGMVGFGLAKLIGRPRSWAGWRS